MSNEPAKKDLLFEIGTEETPANYMPNTLAQIKNLATQKLKDKRINYDEIRVYGTPRRLVLFVKGIAEKQEDLEELVKGPSKKAAFDADGNPTKALQGFLRGQNASLEDVFVQELAGAEYMYVKKQEKGMSTKAVLKTLLPEIMTSITFPKSMKWGNKSFRFARPIRWVMPILEDELVEFDKDGIACGKVTRGHRVLSKGAIEINHVNEYFDKLKEEGFVIVNQDERREMIRKQCEKLAEEAGGKLLADESLLEEIVYLVEYPTALMGHFEEEYLKLPKEVIITPMKEHQRYFPVIGENGNLLNCFITVRNGDSRYLEIVREGNEKVLRARLADGQFFYIEDRKIPLDECAAKLKNVVFQETLGTVHDKVERIKRISRHLAEALELTEDKMQNLLRSAHLCKADLVTNMVKEFDELQGIMGREYAIMQGEKDDVADAILEHYLPRFAGDITPRGKNGCILSISDKMDTISGCFAIGIQPTGSQDPYALRRQAIGIIAIILDSKISLSLSRLADIALGNFMEKGIVKGDVKTIKKDIMEFFKQRYRNVLIDRGFSYDVIDAVLNAQFDNIYESYLKIHDLETFRDREEFRNILASFNRVSNLAAKAPGRDINEELFVEEAEKALLDTFIRVEESFNAFMDYRDYNQALKTLITLRPSIDNFFDNIMVMVEDEGIKNNRLGLLRRIADMMYRFGDLGAIVTK